MAISFFFFTKQNISRFFSKQIIEQKKRYAFAYLLNKKNT
jgi:hypothetical protein